MRWPGVRTRGSAEHAERVGVRSSGAGIAADVLVGGWRAIRGVPAVLPVGSRGIGDVVVLGDEVCDVFSPLVFEYLVAGAGEWATGERSVLVSGACDDDQLAEWARSVGVVTECLLAMVLAAQAEQVPLGCRAA